MYKLNFSKDESGATLFTGAFSPEDATYHIDGQAVKLNDGVSEVTLVPGSASKTITRYFGNEAKYDFDGDGKKDTAFLITQETGGSGTFYYLVVALNTENGYVGSNAVFLGDRIAPQTTEARKGGVVLVNYATRNPGESFAVQPSLGTTAQFVFDPKIMGFSETEADSSPSKD